MSAPIAELRDHVHTEHGIERLDPYYWMRDREDEAVIKYIEAENAYTEAHTRHLADFRKTLYDEMLGRIQETDLSVPVRRGNYWYYTRTEEGQSYPIYCRKHGSVEEGKEEVLLDVNVLGAEYEYVKIGAFTVSPDHSLLAYSIDTSGRERFDVRFKDLRTGEHLPDLIPDIDTGATWAADNQTLFYSVLDDSLRPYQVRRHRLGAPVEQDEVAYQEDDDKFRVASWRTRSDGYVAIGSFSTLTTEIRIVDANKPDGEFIVLAPRHTGLRYSIAHHSEWFYIVTNDSDDAQGKHNDDAINYKLVRAPITSPTRENWVDIIPHRPEVQLVDVDTFAKHLVLTERESGLTQLRIIDLNDNSKDRRVELDEPAYELWGEQNPEFNAENFRFGYSSLVTPVSTFEVNMNTNERALLKQKPVLGGYAPDEYVSKRVVATASDGTHIPVSIVHRKDLELDGERPTLLYGYGSYGINIDPSFNSNRLSLLDRGVVFAIAHIRGSSTMGDRKSVV
jgi:oligopeptidase B